LITQYVLIDYENVQPEVLSALVAENSKVIVFVGSNQTKVTFDTAVALQQMGNKAEYVKISGNGLNALDFHIAFYIGQISAQDPATHFHIISRDTGFDPLIQHLKTKNVTANRWRDVSDMPLVKQANAKTSDERISFIVASNAKTPAERISFIVACLQKRAASKPKTIKTLSGSINALFKKQLTGEELSFLLKEMQARGLITVSGTKVSYPLPTGN